MTLRRYLLAATLFVAGWAVSGPAQEAYDTITLTNGEILSGRILLETQEKVVIELVSEADSRMVSRQEIPQDRIKSIMRVQSGPQSLEQMAAEDYFKIRRYKLDPSHSFAPDVYSRVIDDVFREYLERYPDSKYAGIVKQNIAEWEEERERVIGGEIKRDGVWISSDAYTERSIADWIETADRHLDAGRYESAVALYKNAAERSSAELERLSEPEARLNMLSLREQIYEHFLIALEGQQEMLERKQKVYEDEVEEALDRAEDAWKEYERELKRIESDDDDRRSFRRMRSSRRLAAQQSTERELRDNLDRAKRRVAEFQDWARVNELAIQQIENEINLIKEVGRRVSREYKEEERAFRRR